jgi:S-formylglutathione hydrolase FrmB
MVFLALRNYIGLDHTKLGVGVAMQKRKIYRLSCLLVLLTVSSIGAFSQQAGTASTTGKLVEIKVPAPSLKGNLLGDPVEQTAAVYLPPSYDTSPAKRYPTLYLLHGFLSTNKAWINGGYQGMSLQSLMDEMIKRGITRELIVVAPNGWNTYKGAFYTNSAVNGNWEDYFYHDLVQTIDEQYRTIARPESRGIAGHSMGGYGAVSLAMKHPDVFSVVYALSPCCLGFEGDFASENPAWLSTLRLTKKEQLKDKPGSFEEFFQLAFVAVSAAFSPNPQRPPFFVDFPYSEHDGKLQRNEEVFALWRTKMPLYMVEDNKQNLMKLRGIFIDYGEKEEFSHIRITTQQFSKALSERNIPHVFEIYAGGDHGSMIRQRLETRLIQFFAEKLDFGR